MHARLHYPGAVLNGLLVLLVSVVMGAVMVGTVLALIWIARKVDERRR